MITNTTHEAYLHYLKARLVRHKQRNGSALDMTNETTSSLLTLNPWPNDVIFSGEMPNATPLVTPLNGNANLRSKPYKNRQEILKR